MLATPSGTFQVQAPTVAKVIIESPFAAVIDVGLHATK
jgi:hypothetical protein